VTSSEVTPEIPVRLDFDHAAGFSGAPAHLDNAATKELDRVQFDPACESSSVTVPRS
jgi:hypothetical protein